MNRIFLILAGLFGASGVILGALSSHAFKTILTPEQIDIFKLGVQYQLYHALALFGVAIFSYYKKNLLLNIAGWLFTLGIIFFSGTMYSITYFGLPNIGTAPVGGFAFMFGWFMLIIIAFKTK
ncbi:DUF423 domain-containing protein [Zophobihabitans entericus]|uniref:DUF423 domain-containing protein n=1 Tax=Zophobihabitans entericus TaxID=1635327 RepID=A0A6G9IDV8_9GAMM|nr:DUF423 domain-containing protein [Zophobihabitans entericus]QIQ22017.1 DUF423 domain-containing protein [Zophobihabitans entericus]